MRRLALFLQILLCVVALTAGAVAQEQPGPNSTSASTATATDVTPAINTSDPEAATRAWLETVPADKRAKSDAYFEGGYWLILWNFLLGAAIFLFLLASGVSALLRAFAEKTTRFKALQVALYTIPYVLIVSLLSFPLGI